MLVAQTQKQVYHEFLDIPTRDANYVDNNKGADQT